MKIRENKRPSALLSVRVGLRGFFLFSLSLSVSSFSGDQRWEPVRKAGPQVLPPSSVRPMWTILKVLYLVRAVSTDCTSELFNRRDLPVRVCLASVPLLFSFSLFFFPPIFVLFTEKSMAFVCVGGWCCSQSAHIPEAQRIQNLQDLLLLDKKAHSWKGAAAASPQDKHGRRLITSGGVPGTQERWRRGPFASCTMDGNMQN